MVTLDETQYKYSYVIQLSSNALAQNVLAFPDSLQKFAIVPDSGSNSRDVNKYFISEEGSVFQSM